MRGAGRCQAGRISNTDILMITRFIFITFWIELLYTDN